MAAYQNILPISTPSPTTPSKWTCMRVKLFSGDPDIQYEAAQYFRKQLSQNLSTFNSGLTDLIPRLVELLDETARSQLQFEVTWALTNLAFGSTEDTHLLNESGATARLTALVRSAGDVNVRDQAIWTLSNVAGDCANCRAYLLQLGFLELLESLLETWTSEISDVTSRPESRRTVVWALSNLSRGRRSEDKGRFAALLPVLARLRDIFWRDKDLMVELCWVLVYLTEGEDSSPIINQIIGLGFVNLFVQLLTEYSNPNCLQAAVRAAGNVATGTDEQTQHLIDGGILPALDRLLDQSKESIVREVCWLISNITAGNQNQLETAVSENLQIFAKLNKLIIGNASLKIRKEASWSVCNALTGSNNGQLHKIVETGSLPAVCYVLYQSQDEKLLMAALAAINRVLNAGREECKNLYGKNCYEILVEDCGGLEKILALKDHPANSVQSACYEILSDHFCTQNYKKSGVFTENQSQNGKKSPICVIFRR